MRLHVGNVSWVRRRLPLDGRAGSAALARAFVREGLAEWGHPQLEPVATLLATELVTNVLRHASAGSSELVISCGDGRFRIEVSDSDPRHLPHRECRSLTDEGGRGLALVESLASDWGTTAAAAGGGKTVWCELSLAVVDHPVL